MPIHPATIAAVIEVSETAPADYLASLSLLYVYPSGIAVWGAHPAQRGAIARLYGQELWVSAEHPALAPMPIADLLQTIGATSLSPCEPDWIPVTGRDLDAVDALYV